MVEEVISKNTVKLKLLVSIRIYLVIDISRIIRYRKLVKRQKIRELKLVKCYKLKTLALVK